MARKRAFPLIEDFDNIPEKALVPLEEEPYEIPEHWKWVRLGAFACYGASNPKGDALHT